MDPVAFARGLIDIDSTTGREGEAGRWLARRLRELGFAVTEQPVDGERGNVIATAGPGNANPDVVLSTHFDCVPPFFPSRVDGDRLYGRGACDAKGILAAQVAALERLKREGETRVGLCSSSARSAAATARSWRTPRRPAHGSWSTASRPRAVSAPRRAAFSG